MMIIRHILLLVSCSVIYFGAQAQNVLLLVNNEYKDELDAFLTNSPKQIVIKPGTKVLILKKKSKKKNKGEIKDFLFPKYLILNEKHYNLSKLESIRYMDNQQHLKKVLGPAAMGVGAGLIGVGYYLGNRGFRSLFTKDDAYIYQVTPFSMATAVVGFGSAIVGTYFVFNGAKLTINGFRRKKIDLSGEKWSVSILDAKKLEQTKADNAKKKKESRKNKGKKKKKKK